MFSISTSMCVCVLRYFMYEIGYVLGLIMKLKYVCYARCGLRMYTYIVLRLTVRLSIS
jgi:hypothetical protein